MSNRLSKKGTTRKRPEKRPARPALVRIAIILEAEELEQLNALATSTRRNRSQMVGWLVREATRVVKQQREGTEVAERLDVAFSKIT